MHTCTQAIVLCTTVLKIVHTCAQTLRQVKQSSANKCAHTCVHKCTSREVVWQSSADMGTNVYTTVHKKNRLTRACAHLCTVVCTTVHKCAQARKRRGNLVQNVHTSVPISPQDCHTAPMLVHTCAQLCAHMCTRLPPLPAGCAQVCTDLCTTVHKRTPHAPMLVHN